MSTYSDSKASLSLVKDLTRAAAVIVAKTGIDCIPHLSTLATLPAESFQAEKVLAPYLKELVCFESDKKTFERNLERNTHVMSNDGTTAIMHTANTVTSYKNAWLDSINYADIVWADYCGHPSYINMMIGKDVKVAMATFDLQPCNYNIQTTVNNPFARNLVGTSLKTKVSSIKNYYTRNFPEYELVMSIQYVSSVKSMLVIGLAHKSINYPSANRFIMRNNGTFLTENATQVNKVENGVSSLHAKVLRLASKVGIETNTLITNEAKVKAKVKAKAKVKVKVKAKAKNPEDVIKLMIYTLLDNGFDCQTIAKHLHVTVSKVSSCMAWATIRKNKAKV
jgi:hypothetical protein